MISTSIRHILGLSLFLLSTPTWGEWNPPPPTADEFDWVQLNSGEWLKGTVESYVDNELVFDSDVLGIQTIDDEDIKMIRTAKTVEVGYQPEGVREGILLDRKTVSVVEDRIEVKDGKVTSRTTGNEITSTDDLVTLADGAGSEWDRWTGKISIGANFRSGNTDQVDYNASIDLERLTALSRLQVDYLGNYGKADGDDFANNHRVGVQWDRYLSQRLYLRPISGEWYRDPFQNIGHRLLLGSGIGYEVVDTDDISWRLTAGPAYQYIEYDTVAPGESDNESSLAGVFGSEFSWEINEHIDFESIYQLTVTDEASGLYSHHFENRFSFEITGDLDFDVSFIWDRIEEPSDRADGSTPDQDDFRMIFGLGYEL